MNVCQCPSIRGLGQGTGQREPRADTVSEILRYRRNTASFLCLLEINTELVN